MILLPFLLLNPSFLTAQTDFTDVTYQSGIAHAFHVDMATFGGGVAILDFDNDGYEDLYVTGGTVDGKLYRNLGNGRFVNAFYKAGGFPRTREFYTQGVSAADVNKDGFKDLLITTMYALDGRRTLAPNLLYINNGDGTFTDATEDWGLEDFRSNSQAPTFGDINADGYPDLFIANYYSNALQGVNIFNEHTISNSFHAAIDFLFINVRGKYFVEASGIYGMDHDGFGFQGIFSDYDNDQDLDLYIANDFGFKKTPNRMLRNEYPRKKMLDRSLNVAMNYGMNAMGIASCDYNFDGWMDYFTTNLSTSLFTENKGKSADFQQTTVQLGLAIPMIEDPIYSGIPISWGANFFDYDNDTDMDLFVSNGALNPTIRLNPNFFFEYGEGKFQQVAKDKNLFDEQIGRGSAVFDFDNDGDLDLFVVNQFPRDPSNDLPYARCKLYRNNAEQNDHNWLKISLKGFQSDADGIGSRVEVKVGDRNCIREIDGGSSHLSQSSTIAHFGLEEATEVDVTIKWIGGKIQTLKNVKANQHLVIQEAFETNTTITNNQLKTYPGFFTDEVVLEYEIDHIGEFQIDVIDIKGNVVANIIEATSNNQSGFLTWNVPKNLLRGVYVFRLYTQHGIVSTRGVKL